MDHIPPSINSLRIQQQEPSQVTDLAIAYVQVDEYEQPNQNAAPIPNATTNPNATKIDGDMDKNKAGLHMYPLLEAIYGDIFDPTNDGSKKINQAVVVSYLLSRSCHLFVFAFIVILVLTILPRRDCHSDCCILAFNIFDDYAMLIVD